MRILALALLAGLFTFNATTEAEARRGGTGSKETLEFVATTTIPGPEGKALSLCHLIDHTTALSIPIFATSRGYALASNNCETDRYFPLETAGFLAAQADGVISADLPPEPSIGLARTIWKYTLLTIFALIGVSVVVMVIRSKLRTRARRKEMGPASKVALNTLDAMCHIAKADGEIDEGEVQVIAAISEKLTGTAFPPEKIMQVIEMADAKLTPPDFERFKKGLRPDECRLVMRGVLMVALADGALADAEQKFVGNLAARLRIPQPEVIEMLDALTRPAAPDAPQGPAVPAE